MASDYDGQTVAELKEVLRERGLPVSGAKALLVARLEEFDARSKPEENPLLPTSEQSNPPSPVEIQDGKLRFPCRVCGVLLAVPVGYAGKVECPACSTQQPVGKSRTSEGQYPFNLTQNQWSVAVSISGVVVGLLAIVVFLSSFSYDVMCPEEAQIEIVEDGEIYAGCDGGSWGPTLTRMFVSCCLMVPLAAALTQAGVGLRKPKVEFQQSNSVADASGSTPVAAPAPDQQFTDSPSAELLQLIAKWFGLGLTAASTLLSLVAIAFVSLLIYLVFTY